MQKKPAMLDIQPRRCMQRVGSNTKLHCRRKEKLLFVVLLLLLLLMMVVMVLSICSAWVLLHMHVRWMMLVRKAPAHLDRTLN